MYRWAWLMVGLIGWGVEAQASHYRSYASSHGSRANRVSLDVSGGLATVGGGYGGTFLLGVAIPVSRETPVRLGLASGILFGKGVALPILLSVLFDISSGSVRPYIGGAVGPTIGLSSPSVVIDGFDVPLSWVGHGVKLALLVRPGLAFNVTEVLDLTVEMPLGGLTGIFYICPTVGLSVKL